MQLLTLETFKNNFAWNKFSYTEFLSGEIYYWLAKPEIKSE